MTSAEDLSSNRRNLVGIPRCDPGHIATAGYMPGCGINQGESGRMMMNCPQTENADRWLAQGLEPALNEVLGDPMLAPVMTPRTVKMMRLAAMLARLRAAPAAA